MGLVVGLLLAGIVWVALWRTRTLTRPSLQLAGAALLLGLGGYALQGRIGLSGSPASERPTAALPPAMPIELAAEFYGRFNAASPWVIMANSYCKRGDSGSAVAVIQSGLKAWPKESQLWAALGNALIIHGAGGSSPASQLAFKRSAALAPRHPGPPFFYGLALLQQGQAEAALVLWREAASRGPPGASWQQNLRSRIALVEELRTVAESQAPPQ